MKKLQALLLTGLIVGATASGSFINANAVLSAPTLSSSNISFRNDANNGQWGYYIDNTIWANGPDVITYYTRTQDGIYWNYTNTMNIGGLTITQTYNRSTTGWVAYQGGPTYLPYLTNNIGSNVSGGLIRFIFDNNTNKDYAFYLDYSSSTSDKAWVLKINDVQYSQYLVPTRNTLTKTFLIPSFTKIELFATSMPVYFDAFYLDDLGVSSAWQEGYDLGYGTGESDTLIGLNGGNIFTIIGDAFGAVASLMNIQILPNLSIGIVFGAYIAILILFNILNVANGTPKSGGKK